MFRRRKIITRGFIDNLPDAIELDIEHLKIGQFIYIKDIEEDRCEFLAPNNAVIVGVKTARAAIEEEEEEEEEEELEGETAEGGESKSDGSEEKQESPAGEPAAE